MSNCFMLDQFGIGQKRYCECSKYVGAFGYPKVQTRRRLTVNKTQNVFRRLNYSITLRVHRLDAVSARKGLHYVPGSSLVRTIHCYNALNVGMKIILDSTARMIGR